MRSSYLYEIKYCTWTLIVVDDGRDYTRVRLQSSFIDTLTKHRRMFSDIIPNLRGFTLSSDNDLWLSTGATRLFFLTCSGDNFLRVGSRIPRLAVLSRDSAVNRTPSQSATSNGTNFATTVRAG